MNPRACLLVALLVSPAWSQEPVANPPVPTVRSFDLGNASVKRIIRDAAATQFALVQLSETPAIEREPEATIVFVPPEPKLAPKPMDVPRRWPDLPPGGFLSQVFGILVEEALFDGDDTESDAYSDRWLRCEGRESQKSTQMAYDTCPAKNRDHLSWIR